MIFGLDWQRMLMFIALNICITPYALYVIICFCFIIYIASIFHTKAWMPVIALPKIKLWISLCPSYVCVTNRFATCLPM